MLRKILYVLFALKPFCGEYAKKLQQIVAFLLVKAVTMLLQPEEVVASDVIARECENVIHKAP